MTRVFLDARLAVRGLGINSAVERLHGALAPRTDIDVRVNRSPYGWTRRGKLDTLARSGLLDLDPRLDARTSGFDVVHYFGNSCPRRPDVRTVVTVHDLMMLDAKTPRNRLFEALLMPGLRRRRAKVVAISSRTADCLLNALGLRAETVEVIPHGHRELPVWDGERNHILMFGGSSDPRKRVDLGLRAYSQYASTAGASAMPLVIAGRAGVSDDHLALIRHGQVHVELDPDREVIDELLARAACLIYPSRREGFGLPILEAGEVGTPVVYDRNAEIPKETLGTHAIGAEAATPAAFAACVSEAVCTGPIHAALSGHPSWGEVANRYYEIYRGVAS